eukprot:COSAG05_NODE_11610_length_505_cov_0.886700_1_plen_70_part_10
MDNEVDNAQLRQRSTCGNTLTSTAGLLLRLLAAITPLLTTTTTSFIFVGTAMWSVCVYDRWYVPDHSPHT